MRKVITGTVFAVAALATTAAFAESAKPVDAKPTFIERLVSGTAGVSSKATDKSTSYSASDRVRLNGYAPTGKPHVDNWVRDLRRFRTDGPNG